MIIRVFKVSTKEMYKFQNKYELYMFVREVTNRYPSYSNTIDQLIGYLPVEDYCRIV
jgi:hypothetical protein